jgi:hypothetical protein
MIWKHIIGDVDQDSPARDVIAVARIDGEVYLNTGEYTEKADGSFKFKANGPQMKVRLDDLLHSLGFEWNE